MLKFFKQIYNKIIKFDDYTNQYIKIKNSIEIPSLAYTNWGIHYANLKDYQNAIEKLETAKIMSLQNPKPCISLGVIYAKLREYKKAENVLLDAIKRDSQNAYAYSVLSSVYVAEDKFDKAEAFIKKALKISPSDAEIYMNYGILYAKMKKKLKAIEMLKKSKFLNPTNPHTYFMLGVMLFETDKTEEAFSEFKQLENINPNYKNLNYYIALCYKKEKNQMAVLEYAQRALAEDETNPAIYILLAQTYTTLDRMDDVFKIYEKGEKLNINDFDFYLSWGISFLRVKDTKNAKEKLYKSLEIQMNNSTALYRLGSCYYLEEDREEAEKLFKKALESEPNNSMAMSDLGILYYDKKDYNNAIQTFFKAVELSKDKSYLYFYIANCYYKMGRLKKSIDYYEKTIEYYPGHIEALINLSLCMLEIKNEREALRKIRNAYQINRNSEKVIILYALIDLKAGIYSDALEKSDILLNKNPDKIEAKIIKTNALINLNKPQEALNILYSLPEEEQNSDTCVYLYYTAYKILVEENPSHYNESMLVYYMNKMNSKTSNNSISNYIQKALNINKG